MRNRSTRAPETRETGAHTFHYDRSERLERGGVDRDGSPQKSGGLFKRNRSLAIVVIDLLVILLIYGLYVLFFAPAGHTATIAGHEMTLRAFSFDQDLYLTVRAVGSDDAESRPVTVVFAVGEETEVVQALLPGAGQARTVRAIVEGAVADRVTATISVGQDSQTLRASVDAD
jgi:hypothetical protein